MAWLEILLAGRSRCEGTRGFYRWRAPWPRAFPAGGRRPGQGLDPRPPARFTGRRLLDGRAVIIRRASRSANPYTWLARVYDQPDHEEVTRSFLKRAAPLVAARPPGTWVLDLACGTGVAAAALARRDVPVLGVDRSRAMLAVARRRCRGTRTRFVAADLASFTADRPCSVALACGDILNHLPTAAALRRVLRRVRSQLTPGGVLAFESLRRFCYEAYWDDRTYHMEGPGGDLVMECDWDGRRGVATARLVGYVKRGRNRYTKFETVLTEYHHTNATLREALRQAGFRRLRAERWSPWPDQHLEPELDRVFWTAHRPGRHA